MTQCCNAASTTTAAYGSCSLLTGMLSRQARDMHCITLDEQQQVGGCQASATVGMVVKFPSATSSVVAEYEQQLILESGDGTLWKLSRVASGCNIPSAGATGRR